MSDSFGPDGVQKYQSPISAMQWTMSMRPDLLGGENLTPIVKSHVDVSDDGETKKNKPIFHPSDFAARAQENSTLDVKSQRLSVDVSDDGETRKKFITMVIATTSQSSERHRPLKSVLKASLEIVPTKSKLKLATKSWASSLYGKMGRSIPRSLLKLVSTKSKLKLATKSWASSLYGKMGRSQLNPLLSLPLMFPSPVPSMRELLSAILELVSENEDASLVVTRLSSKAPWSGFHNAPRNLEWENGETKKTISIFYLSDFGSRPGQDYIHASDDGESKQKFTIMVIAMASESSARHPSPPKAVLTALRYLGVRIREQSYMFGDNKTVVKSSA
jgi:hypothetical protein